MSCFEDKFYSHSCISVFPVLLRAHKNYPMLDLLIWPMHRIPPPLCLTLFFAVFALKLSLGDTK